MLYFDTSFLAPLYVPEPSSEYVRDVTFKLAKDNDIAISEWTCVEFSSMIARRVRMNLLAEDDAKRLLDAFELISHAQYLLLTPTQGDYRLANRFLRNFSSGLRAGDALHLAIAKNHGAHHVYSLDQGLVKAAIALGLPASAGS